MTISSAKRVSSADWRAPDGRFLRHLELRTTNTFSLKLSFYNLNESKAHKTIGKALSTTDLKVILMLKFSIGSCGQRSIRRPSVDLTLAETENGVLFDPELSEHEIASLVDD